MRNLVCALAMTGLAVAACGKKESKKSGGDDPEGNSADAIPLTMGQPMSFQGQMAPGESGFEFNAMFVLSIEAAADLVTEFKAGSTDCSDEDIAGSGVVFGEEQMLNQFHGIEAGNTGWSQTETYDDLPGQVSPGKYFVGIGISSTTKACTVSGTLVIQPRGAQVHGNDPGKPKPRKPAKPKPPRRPKPDPQDPAKPVTDALALGEWYHLDQQGRLTYARFEKGGQASWAVLQGEDVLAAWVSAQVWELKTSPKRLSENVREVETATAGYPAKIGEKRSCIYKTANDTLTIECAHDSWPSTFSANALVMSRSIPNPPPPPPPPPAIDPALTGAWAFSVSDMGFTIDVAKSWSADGPGTEKFKFMGDLVYDVGITAVTDTSVSPHRLTETVVSIAHNDVESPFNIGDKLYCIYEVTPQYRLRLECAERGSTDFPAEFSDEANVFSKD